MIETAPDFYELDGSNYRPPAPDPQELERIQKEASLLQEIDALPDAGEGGRQSLADMLVNLVVERCELFHDENRNAFACPADTCAVLPINGRQFRDWLAAVFFEEHQKSVRKNALEEARITLEGLAMKEQRLVYVRVAGAAGEYWLDLGQRDNNLAVFITANGWTVRPAEVHFFRPENLLPLPEPAPSGQLGTLWEVCNLPETSRLLVVAWLADTLRPDTPFPVLELLGEQGSAKSSTQEALRNLLDPNTSNLRGSPKNAEDLYVSAGVNHFVSYENVSYLNPALQDAMCVVATGGGFAKRKLYTDADETVIQVKRPIVLNGISASVTQQDLVSRTLSVELPVLNDAKLKNTLEDLFKEHHAGMLGALLNITAKALQWLPEAWLPAERRPRLVEFAYLGMATAKAQGLDPEDFMKQLDAAREDGLERTLDASPVASAIRDWSEVNRRLEVQTAKNWLDILEGFKPRGCESWPRSAKGLGDAMRRAAPALRQLGIECKCLGKVGGSIKWRIGSKPPP